MTADPRQEDEYRAPNPPHTKTSQANRVYLTKLDEAGNPVGEPMELTGTMVEFTLPEEPAQEELVWPALPKTWEFPLTPREAARLKAWAESIWGPMETWPEEPEEEDA